MNECARKRACQRMNEDVSDVQEKEREDKRGKGKARQGEGPLAFPLK